MAIDLTAARRRTNANNDKHQSNLFYDLLYQEQPCETIRAETLPSQENCNFVWNLSIPKLPHSTPKNRYGMGLGVVSFCF